MGGRMEGTNGDKMAQLASSKAAFLAFGSARQLNHGCYPMTISRVADHYAQQADR